MGYFTLSSHSRFESDQITGEGIERLKKIEEINSSIDDIVRNSKVLCFTMDYPDKPQSISFGRGFQHPRMWAQYASNHTGVCLVLNKERFLEAIDAELGGLEQFWMGHVDYIDRDYYASKAMTCDLKECSGHGIADYLNNHIAKHYRDLYFRKNIDWRDEQEFRIILRDGNEDPVYVLFEESLEAVILGVDFPKGLVESIIQQCIKLNKKCGQI
jgi:hypothetical protein